LFTCQIQYEPPPASSRRCYVLKSSALDAHHGTDIVSIETRSPGATAADRPVSALKRVALAELRFSTDVTAVTPKAQLDPPRVSR